ncbi:cell division protein DamX [Siccibacter turicensis]|uniref:cell division protein DamX n=1 Tax=Siccibacter turicensis TaxID=357233 RepID=UPI003F561F19
MDEFKPEDELKPDPSDRPARGRKTGGNNEPQINFDDVDLDGDDPRPSRARRTRERDEDDYPADEALAEDDAAPRPRRRKSKAAPAKGPVSRQHLMMGLGILVLLLLIFGIGSALNTPNTDNATADKQPAERSIDLSGNSETAANQANGAQPQPGTTSAANPAAPQEISVPPVAATPTEGQAPATPDNQRRVEVPGDLNNALTQQQGQIDNVASGSTLPTEPATVAAIHGSEPARAATTRTPQPTGTKAAPVRERQRAVIEPAPRKTETAQSKPQTTTKTSEPKAAATKPAAPAASAAPKATASAAPSSAAASASGSATGNVNALKSAPGNHYTLQLSSSSNYNNLNAWAKKENLSNVVVYKTTRNGQPWYVLVSGVYASKDEARRAVNTLPADVQAKNPWAKPIHQVQADLKQ